MTYHTLLTVFKELLVMSFLFRMTGRLTNSHSKIIKIDFNSFYWLRTVTVSINSYQNKSSFIALLNKVQTTKTTGVRSNKFRSTDIYKYNSTE